MELEEFIESDITKFLDLEFKPREETKEQKVSPETQLLSIEGRDYEKEFNLALQENLFEKARSILLSLHKKLEESKPGSYQEKYFKELYEKLSKLYTEVTKDRLIDYSQKKTEEVSQKKIIEEKEEKIPFQNYTIDNELIENIKKILELQRDAIFDKKNIVEAISKYHRLKNIITKEIKHEETKKEAKKLLLEFYSLIKKRLSEEVQLLAVQRNFDSDFSILSNIKELKKRLNNSVKDKDIVSALRIYEEMRNLSNNLKNIEAKKELDIKLKKIYVLLKNLEEHLVSVKGSKNVEAKEKGLILNLP